MENSNLLGVKVSKTFLKALSDRTPSTGDNTVAPQDSRNSAVIHSVNDVVLLLKKVCTIVASDTKS